MLKLRYFSIVVFLLMGGCAVTPNLEHVPVEDLVHIEREKLKFDILGRGFSALIQNVSDENGALVAKNSVLYEPLSDLVLEAGTYIFEVKCSGSNLYSISTVEKDLQAGTDYIVYCVPVKGRNILGLKAIKKIIPAMSAKQDFAREKAEAFGKAKEVEASRGL